ncbi:MAG: hypothetical protein LBL04_10530 [Bacteroidales bacterium]|jgi:hypothetical protein|nr:hypothetical protein [Bacteroidales bacterium]
MKTKFLILGLSVSLVFCLTLIVAMKKMIDMRIGQLQSNSASYYQTRLEEISQIRPYEWISEGYRLSSDLEVTTDNDRQVLLKDIIKVPTLIYRFTDTNCKGCIENRFMLLQKENRDVPENIVILCTPSTMRVLRILNNVHGLKFKLYILSTMDLPIDQQHNSYFFVIHPDLTSHSFFTITEETSLKAAQYLSIVKNKVNMK